MNTNLSDALHLINGDSAAGTLKVALHLASRNILINEDPIACGPAPYTTDLVSWRKTREAFIRALYRDWPHFSFDAYANRGLLMNLEALRAPGSKVLWAGAALAEQLFVAWVIFLFDCIEADISTLKAAQFEFIRHEKAVWLIRSMGELSAERIREYTPNPQYIKRSELDSYRKAWRVYTSDNPHDLVKFLDSKDHVAILRRAMQRLVYRYPSVTSGLSLCDEDLLKYTAEKGPKAPRIIGYTIGMNDSRDFLGDQYVFNRLLRMGDASLAKPLVSLAGDTTSMRTCEARLTEFGQSVLSGDANAIKVNGIDDWIGGVHLTGHNDVPFRDGDSLHVPR